MTTQELREKCSSLGIKNYVFRTDEQLEVMVKVAVLLDKYQLEGDIDNYNRVESLLEGGERMSIGSIKKEVLQKIIEGNFLDKSLKKKEHAVFIADDVNVEKTKKRETKKIVNIEKKSVGVISSIFDFLKKESLTKEEIVLKLKELFPGKESKSMLNTVTIQLGKRKAELEVVMDGDLKKYKYKTVQL